MKKEKENTLRTLKDLEILEADEDNPTQNVEWFIKELKAEAVKWYKELKKFNETAQMFWIKHFFNLTEEDLK